MSCFIHRAPRLGAFHSVTGLAIAALAVGLSASAASAASLYPTTLFENTTGYADSLFIGAPDGTSGNDGTAWIGIGGQIVTYDFGIDRVVNGAGSDFNVYEVNWGSAEFGSITVSASLDGLTFTDLSASEAAWVDIDGDEAHGVPGFARSYDLGALSMARYVRIDGNGTGASGGYNGFDLDAIGAINFTLGNTAAVPLPASLPLLLGGLGLVAGITRRRKHG